MKPRAPQIRCLLEGLEPASLSRVTEAYDLYLDGATTPADRITALVRRRGLSLRELLFDVLRPEELKRSALGLGLRPPGSADACARGVLGRLVGWRSFDAARQYARRLRLRQRTEWDAFCSGERPGQGQLALDVPADPDRVYRGVGWRSWRDWLGPEPLAASVAWSAEPGFRPFEHARAFARSLGLRNTPEWLAYCREELFAEVGRRPADIPAGPARHYAEEWRSMKDWLGTECLTFEDGRRFAQNLGLATSEEWKAWCRGELPERGLPALENCSSPHTVYAACGWRGFGDWLGTGNRHTRPWRPFEEARAFARGLGLRNHTEWNAWASGEFLSMPPRPDDIPHAPARAYADVGWVSMGDWLGTGRIAPQKRAFRPFESARSFVRGLELASAAEWKGWCAGTLADKPRRPDDIPTHPHVIYADRWRDYGDWLGTGVVSTRVLGLGFWPFARARAYARALDLASIAEWTAWAKGERPDLPRRAAEMPAAPNNAYGDQGWQSWGDWLGTGRVATARRVHRPFEDARAFVHTLRFRSFAEWRAWRRGDFARSRPAPPDDIPGNPREVYGGAWRGWSDWLGNGQAPRSLAYRPSFEEARAFAHSLGLRNSTEWKRWCRGTLDRPLPPRPSTIPVTPERVYRDHGWTDWRDWLGDSAAGTRPWRSRLARTKREQRAE